MKGKWNSGGGRIRQGREGRSEGKGLTNTETVGNHREEYQCGGHKLSWLRSLFSTLVTESGSLVEPRAHRVN